MTEAWPDPPRNVQLVTRDERRIPVDCVYTGVDDDGLHVWEIVAPADGWPDVKSVTIDVLPPQTGIVVPLGEESR